MAAHKSKHLHSKKSDKNPICILHNLFCHAIIEKAILFYFVFIERNVLCQFENRYAVSAFFSWQSAPCRFAPGCSIPFLEQEESDGSGYLFTASLAANPKSLDPQSATDAASKTIIENLYEGLVELDENGSPQLAAAENYTVSPDGLTYTFTLKSDRFWFYDANADDVVDDDEKWQGHC